MIPIATRLRTFAGTLALAGLLLIAEQPFAQAQIVALVGGEPITQADIAQRTRLIQLSTQKAPGRQEVLDELIDDKLKVQLSKRYIAEVPKREIDSAFSSIARRAGMSPDQFSKMMVQSGISVEALKGRLHADFVWSQIVRGKFQSSLQVGEKEVEVKLQAATKTDQPANYEYRLRPILFLVPRGSAGNVVEARKRDAEALRARFQNCDTDLRSAMGLPDVVVRATITRQSSELGQQQRELLNNTAVGKLTPPDITMQGVEVFAVCAKTPAAGDSPQKREVRDQMYNERFTALSKKFLKELRSQALIEIRQ
jgi:peptidyl-prolyl cis-trans isomerase SurA